MSWNNVHRSRARTLARNQKEGRSLDSPLNICLSSLKIAGPALQVQLSSYGKCWEGVWRNAYVNCFYKQFVNYANTLELLTLQSCEEALRNPLNLCQIFKKLPSKFLLLVSCSLVKISWNKESRTFIRDYRKCRARRPNFTTDCQSIQELDQMCCHITEECYYGIYEFTFLRLFLYPVGLTARISGRHSTGLWSY